MSKHDQLIQQTRKWVAIAFFEPMLKQMRQSPFHSKLLDGGEGGEAFASMYDERLSEKMSSSASDTLVNSIVRKIEAKKAYEKQSKNGVRTEGEGADRVRQARAAAATNAIPGAGHVAPNL
jgi:Rod binding domain-containing protein